MYQVINGLLMGSLCQGLSPLLAGLVPSGLHGHSAAVWVCLVAAGSSPAVTLLVPISWSYPWQAVTFKPTDLSFLICQMGVVMYLSCGNVTSSYFGS